MEAWDAAVHLICIQIMHDVVDVKWEVRHGAALAVACILAVVPQRYVYKRSEKLCFDRFLSFGITLNLRYSTDYLYFVFRFNFAYFPN